MRLQSQFLSQRKAFGLLISPSKAVAFMSLAVKKHNLCYHVNVRIKLRFSQTVNCNFKLKKILIFFFYI